MRSSFQWVHSRKLREITKKFVVANNEFLLIASECLSLEGVFCFEQHMIAGLTLAPHSLSGHQVCDGRSTGCAASCNLWFAGQRVTPNARHRALTDTRDLFTDRPAFIERLNKDIAALVHRAEKYQVTPLIRLNVASDLEWFDVSVTGNPPGCSDA